MSSVAAVSWSLLVALVATAPAPDGGLGTALRQDGYSLRPPQGFQMVRMDLFHGTRAAAVGPSGATRFLSAALSDGTHEGAAMLLVSVVDGSFEVTPSARDDFSTAVVRHFADELGLTFAMERSESVSSAVPRIEVLGTVKQEHQARSVLVAAMAGEGKHVVITASVPSGRWQALAPAVAAALASFRNESPGGTELPRGVAAGVALTVAVALLGSVALWRRREQRGGGPGPA